MKYLLTLCLLATLFTGCVKGDRQNTKYKIEVTGDNIQEVYYSTRDHGAQSVMNINSGTWSYEWKKGYSSNEISVQAICDGAGTIKIYRKGDVVTTESGTGTINAKFEN